MLRRLSACPKICRLVVTFLYGTGLRLLEGLRLRVKDLDFEIGQITVREARVPKTG